MAPALRGTPRGAVGHDDLTDAPNFGTEFGRRRPCPRYGVLRLRPPQGVGHDDPGVPRRGCPERGVVAGDDLRQSTPIFFLERQKENGGGAVKRKNAFRCAVTGAERPPAQRDAALNGPAQLR